MVLQYRQGESSVILYQDEKRNEHKVCVRKKKNEYIGMKCSIGVHTDKPWIAIRPEAFIPSNLCSRKLITLLLVVLGSMIFAIAIRFFEPCIVKSDTYIISIVFLLVIVICYPLMYWNHINSQEERKKVWEKYEEG